MMPTPNRLLRFLTPIVVLLACGDEELGPRVPAGIVVTPEAPRVLLGETLLLAARVMDAAGHEIPGQSVTFHSSDATVLTVSDAGLLVSVGSTGTSLITAASGDVTAEVEAEVVLPPSAIVAEPRVLELDTGEQVLLAVTVTGETGEPIPGAPVAFATSNVAIARVERNGDAFIVTGTGRGDATVTLTSGDRTAEVPVTVAQFPASAVITPSSLVFTTASGSQQVTAALLDRTGDEVDPPEPFTWTSSDDGVAAVGPTGMVTIVGTGSAVITATTATFSATLGVFVGTPPEGEMLARLDFPSADGLAVTADGRYFVTGLDRFSAGALPDFGFSEETGITGTLSGVTLNAEGTRAYVIRTAGGASGPSVFRYDLDPLTGVDLNRISSELPTTGAISEDGSVFTVGTPTGIEVIPLNTASRNAIAVGQVHKITHHPSSPLLYASGAPGVLELDPTSGEILRRFGRGVSSHAVTPDGARVYTVNPPTGIGVWNLETGEPERGFPHVPGTDLAVSSDGRFLYVIFATTQLAGGSRLYIVDRASGALLREVVLGGVARRIGMAGDGTAVITNAGPGGWVDFVR